MTDEELQRIKEFADQHRWDATIYGDTVVKHVTALITALEAERVKVGRLQDALVLHCSENASLAMRFENEMHHIKKCLNETGYRWPHYTDAYGALAVDEKPQAGQHAPSGQETRHGEGETKRGDETRVGGGDA